MPPARILVFCIALALAALSAAELYNRLADRWVPAVAPLTEARQLAAEERWAEVKLLSDFVARNPGTGDAALAARISEWATREMSSFRGQVRRFARGAATGEPTDGASMLGSLSLDLFLIGDIRDLAVQGWKELRYGEGDGAILALSAVGLSTTLAPQFDWAPALLKALKRSGALTREFLSSLTRSSRTALRTGRFGPVGKLVNDLGRVATRLGPGPLRGAMPAVNSAGDLSRLAKASARDPQGTYVIARLFGNPGVKRISKDGGNVGALVTSVKAGSRLGKIAHKALGALPDRWLWVVLLAAVGLAAASLPRRRRRRLPAGSRREPLVPATAQHRST